MKNYIKNENQYDDFSKRIKQKLENHRLLIDEDCWDEIELRMKSKNKKTKRNIVFVLNIAAMFLLLFLFYPYSETIKLNDNTTKEYGKSYKNKETKTNKYVITNKIKEEKEYKQIAVAKQQKSISDKIIAATNEIKILNDTVGGNNSNEIYTDNESLIQTIQETKNENKVDNKKEEDTLLDIEPSYIPFSKTKKNINKWLIAASIASGGDLSTNISLSDNISHKQQIVKEPNLPPETKDDILSLDDFTDINHSAPLSFGIKVRKNLSKHIGIESGLVYTYLSSSFEKSSNTRYSAKLNLHYLGIPVNVVGSLWKNSNWNVYLTAGGMIEKGLKSVYNQYVHKNNEVENTSVVTNINGLQWSLNTSAGVSYRIYENWSLYLEPHVSYYFNNNQPISIRTEHPVVLTLSSGLKYEF